MATFCAFSNSPFDTSLSPARNGDFILDFIFEFQSLKCQLIKDLFKMQSVREREKEREREIEREREREIER